MNFTEMLDTYWLYFLVGQYPEGPLGGLSLTLLLAALGLVLALPVGLLLGLMRVSPWRALRWPVTAWVFLVRATPLLMVVFWAYFFPAVFGLQLSKFTSVLIALTLFTAAYIAEIVRGGIRSVEPGHVEAARALGLSPFEARLYVVLPQAFFNMLPALAGRYVVAIKNTSLAFLIGLADLTEIGKQIGARLMTAPVEVYLTLLLVYFLVNRGLSLLLRALEDRRRFNRVFLRI